MILADTSIWVDHFRKTELRLKALLEQNKIFMHTFIVGELAMGSLAARMEVLAALDRLPQARAASPLEVRSLIETRSLMGTGLGYIDAHILASVLLTPGLRLWTRDKRLAIIAMTMNLAATF